MADTQREPAREQLLDTALMLADRHGWEALRLHQLAAACGVGLDDVRTHFREKDEIIDAWLDRADAAMLRHADRGDVDALPVHERIGALILVWLDVLAPYQRVAREMIAHKLEFGHLHVQFPALLRISRTVQWIREGARLDAPLPRRALEESALTALFVKTFAFWLHDRSPGLRRSRARLERDLRGMQAAARWLPGARVDGNVQRASPPAATSPDPMR